MTTIYTETHLTQDPVYNHHQNSATFTVALSELNITCHIHHQESISYMHQNELLSGDKVRIQGVFLTTKIGDTITTYIKVNAITIVTKELRNIKKRKLDEISSLSPNLKLYKEVGLDFSEYYFLLSGQAYSILDNYNRQQPIRNKSIQAKALLLTDILNQLYCIYIDFCANGINQLHVVNFVNTATSFMKTLNQIKSSHDGELLPENISLCRKTPLPSFIYHAYVDE